MPVISGGFNNTKSLTITVPMLHPGLNQLRKKFKDPMAYKRLRDSWQRTIYYLIDSNPRSWLEAMARLDKKMHVSILLQHKKLYDKDNISVKVILDSLVRLKMLANDDAEHLELSVDQEKINFNATRISICEAL